MMITITETIGETPLKHVAQPGQYTAHVRGAPNFLIESMNGQPAKCTHYIAADGSKLELTDDVRLAYMANVDELYSQMLCVHAVATRKLGSSSAFFDVDDTDTKFENIAQGLTLCGLCASIDPVRDGVKEAVKTSRTTGSRVVIIIGDYLPTAMVVAKNINILNWVAKDGTSSEAANCSYLRPERNYLPDETIDQIVSWTKVFARAKPEDKIEIVKSLQRQGFVCPMTGDGVNDAPALRLGPNYDGVEVKIGLAVGRPNHSNSSRAIATALSSNRSSNGIRAHRNRVTAPRTGRPLRCTPQETLAEALAVGWVPTKKPVGVVPTKKSEPEPVVPVGVQSPEVAKEEAAWFCASESQL